MKKRERIKISDNILSFRRFIHSFPVDELIKLLESAKKDAIKKDYDNITVIIQSIVPSNISIAFYGDRNLTLEDEIEKGLSGDEILKRNSKKK